MCQIRYCCLPISVNNDVSYIPATNDALKYLMDSGLIVDPSNAVNVGEVSNSELEMSRSRKSLL